MPHYEISPEHEFKYELGCIKNIKYLEMVTSALQKVPEYFWFVPASSSGKYHPKSSLGMGGLVRHVKSVFRISEELMQNPLYAPFSEDEKDLIRCAIILHDACKQGTHNKGSHTVTEHPLLVRDFLRPYDKMDEDTERAWDTICNYIETHMGIWNKDKEGREVLNIPQSKAQLFVHLCDFLASRKVIEVDVQDREAQSDYNKNSWRNDLATDGQIDHIKRLYVMAVEKNVNLPPVQITVGNKRVLTKGKASDIIDEAKKALQI